MFTLNVAIYKCSKVMYQVLSHEVSEEVGMYQHFIMIVCFIGDVIFECLHMLAWFELDSK